MPELPEVQSTVTGLNTVLQKHKIKDVWTDYFLRTAHKRIDNIKNKKSINFCLYKNKELVQQGNSSNMLHNFEKIVAYISQYFSINIGDLIFTGTPAGVGETVVGDELELFIEDESLLKFEVK